MSNAHTAGSGGTPLVTIDMGELYGQEDTAKLNRLRAYEALALEKAGRGRDVILTGPGPIWLYLRVAHALHGVARKLFYDDPKFSSGEPLLIFDHSLD